MNVLTLANPSDKSTVEISFAIYVTLSLMYSFTTKF